MTLGIGGVGVMNIMLVSVDERIREIGLRRALGAKKWQIKLQFLAETLLIMLLGGAAGVLLSYAIAAAVGTLPLMGPLFEDDSGKADIHLRISMATVMLSTLVLLAVGVVSGHGAGAARLEAGPGGGAAVRVRRGLQIRDCRFQIENRSFTWHLGCGILNLKSAISNLQSAAYQESH